MTSVFYAMYKSPLPLFFLQIAVPEKFDSFIWAWSKVETTLNQ
jgi:hypothetical protein